tara:strand:+ start:1173 stop:1454 length:282 start_codon:yes stop_codon:yes gene_type:complete
MKNNFLFLAGISVFMFVACEDDDHDHDSDCHECHIAYNNDTVQVDIGEFCGDDLANVEANGYTLTEDMMVGDVTIPAGLYTDIHCEEHGDHDH